ncbi:Uncharacterised protein [Neisseria meningitidis]|nr:Uncharacterised protein [Neisseria meningitidis]
MTGFEIAAFIGSNRSRSAVIPTKVGIQLFEFQSFPINCLSIECLDSRLRGNDGGAVSVFSSKYPQAKIPLFSQKQKTKNRNLKFVIPTNLHPVIPTNLHSVIPTKVGIQFFEFQSFPINCLSIECLDSRLRGNDESIRTETCTTSFPRTCTTSFPRKWESSSFGFACFKFRVTSTSSFPRKWESSFLSFSHSR